MIRRELLLRGAFTPTALVAASLIHIRYALGAPVGRTAHRGLGWQIGHKLLLRRVPVGLPSASHALVFPVPYATLQRGTHAARLPVAAPELLEFQGRLYLAALTPQLDGLRTAPLEFA